MLLNSASKSQHPKIAKIGFIFEYLPKIPHLTLALNLYLTTKKEPLLWFFFNGGNDEARTRDLMRDRHAL